MRLLNRMSRRSSTDFADRLRVHQQLRGKRPDQVPEESQMSAGHQRVVRQTAVVDEFLPPDLRVPSRDQVTGRMTAWPRALALDEQMIACTRCGMYRDWLIISSRNQIWLRCRAGHQQHEPRLDTAWYIRSTGPADVTHATFEGCLRHLGC